MARLEIALRLPDLMKAGESVELRFRGLEDFHPDQLIQQIKPLANLGQCRNRLLNPASAAAAAAELEGLLRGGANTPATRVPEPAPTESNDALLSRLLERPAGSPPSPKPTAASGIDIQGLIRNIVGGTAVAGPSPHQAALLSALDAEMTAQLQPILHHPAFQALEAAWRGIDLLVRNFGAEETVKLYLLNVSKAELAEDLKAHEELGQTEICRLLSREGNELSWAALIGLYSFEDAVEEIEMLGRLAKIAALMGAPLIAGASPRLAGCDSFGEQPDPDDWKRAGNADFREAWQALRELPEAAFLGLALPRFLLRQPYGRASDPIAAFPFEEVPGGLPHEAYLWGNPSVLCGYLLASTFQAEGWEMQPGGYGEVGELPVHRFYQDGETKVKPCAEAWLSERAGEAILEKGLMPVLSIKGRDAVRLVNLQSLRSPTAALAGRWS